MHKKYSTADSTKNNFVVYCTFLIRTKGYPGTDCLYMEGW